MTQHIVMQHKNTVRLSRLASPKKCRCCVNNTSTHHTHPVYVLKQPLPLEGAYCWQSTQALPIVLENRAEGQSIQPLELTRGGQVQALNPVSVSVGGFWVGKYDVVCV